MRKKTLTNLLLICLGSFVTGVSLTLITPFYPTEALSKVNTRESTVCHQVMPGGHSDAVGHCSQYGLHSHGGLHSRVWKGIEYYHIHFYLKHFLFSKYIQIIGSRKSIIIGAVLIGVGNISFGFLTKVQNGELFFGLLIFIRYS